MALVFPNNPTVGQTHTNAGRAWQWTGARWQRYDIAGVIVSPTAPTNPVPGMRWIHEDQGRAYEYLDDTWVELGGGGGGTSGPVSYNDLTDLPTLGSAAATASTDYATAAQGTTADSALQPDDLTPYRTSSDQDTIDAGKASTSHTHDDRYYTETEMNTLLAGKQASGSYASATHQHAISDTTGLQTALDGKQASGSYAAATHTHDDRYYTETEVNNLLAGKQFICQFTSDINANTNRPAGSYGSYADSATNTPTGSGILHNFTSGSDGSGDGSQIWQEYVTNRLWARQRWGGNWTAWAEISLAGHTHDDRYYTETEMNTLLDGKQASGSYVVTTDSRLSDARTPTSHNHDASNIISGTLANDRLPARLGATAQSISDWNAALENGWYQGNQAANAPEGVLDWWIGQVETHNGAWVTQTIYRFTADAPTNTHWWRRSSSDNGAGGRTWGAWYKLQLSQAEQDARYQASGSYVVTTDSRLSDARTPTSHTHDDRYYTETEVNTLLGNYVATTDARLSDATLSSRGLMPAADKNYLDIMKAAAPSLNYSDPSNGLTTIRSLEIASGLYAGGDEPSVSKRPGIYMDAWVDAGSQYGQAQYAPRIDIYNRSVIAVANPFIRFLSSGGTVIGSINRNTAGSGVSYNTTSDYRLKTNIEPLTDAVVRLLQIPTHRFNWLADPDGEKVDGFLAHEAQAIVPESVTGTKDAEKTEEYEVTPAVKGENGEIVTPAVMGTRTVPDYQGIDQSKLVPLLVAAVQELAARVAVLES